MHYEEKGNQGEKEKNLKGTETAIIWPIGLFKGKGGTIKTEPKGRRKKDP